MLRSFCIQGHNDVEVPIVSCMALKQRYPGKSCAMTIDPAACCTVQHSSKNTLKKVNLED